MDCRLMLVDQTQEAVYDQCENPEYTSQHEPTPGRDSHLTRREFHEKVFIDTLH